MIEAKEEDDKIWQCKGFVDEVVADAKYERMREDCLLICQHRETENIKLKVNTRRVKLHP
jgi:hypothetical protein